MIDRRTLLFSSVAALLMPSWLRNEIVVPNVFTPIGEVCDTAVFSGTFVASLPYDAWLRSTLVNGETIDRADFVGMTCR